MVMGWKPLPDPFPATLPLLVSIDWYRNGSWGGDGSKGTRRGQAHFSDVEFVSQRAPIGRKMSQTHPRERLHG